jgi:hypothetical protein
MYEIRIRQRAEGKRRKLVLGLKKQEIRSVLIARGFNPWYRVK